MIKHREKLKVVNIITEFENYLPCGVFVCCTADGSRNSIKIGRRVK